MCILYYILDAFTDTPFQGNPAGVFFDDEGVLTAKEMRRMAGEVGLESAFVAPAAPDLGADFRLRYFTGVIEVPFCGHDTVAAAAALVHAGRAKAGDFLRFATPVGIIKVLAGRRRITLFQNLPEFGLPVEAQTTERIAAALGCAVDAITATDLPVQRVSTGTPWLIVPVDDMAVVDAAPADLGAITQLSRETDTFGIYVFAIDAAETEAIGDCVAVWSRCFAPIAGLNEDPVTGSASGALGGYLAQHDVLKVAPRLSERIIARQGFAGGRGGQAQIVVWRDAEGKINRVSVSGEAVLVAEGMFTLARPA